MNSIFKRTVATFLTAGMLLSGLTACKTLEERKQENLINAVSKDSEMEFDNVFYAITWKDNLYYRFSIVSYKKPLESDSDETIYYATNYKISKEDHDAYKELISDNEAFYPFSNETTSFLKKIVKDYDPYYIGEAKMSMRGYRLLDDLVEQYGK